MPEAGRHITTRQRGCPPAARPRLPAAWGPALLLGLLVAACASPPPARVDTPFGVARAATREQAEELAEMLRVAVPELRQTLPGALERTTDVWLEDFGRHEQLRHRPAVVGLATTSSGLVRIRADRLGKDADFVLAHELVHALLGPDWDPLPGVATEGLCDALAARLAPESAAPIRAARRLDAAFGWPRLSLELRLFDPSLSARTVVRLPLGDDPLSSPTELLALPGRGLHLGGARVDEPFLYAVGMVVVERVLERHGLEHLHALCERARREGLEQVPPAWLLEAAGLDETPATWHHALLDGLDEADLREQLRYVSVALARWLVDSFRARYPELDARGFLENGLPTIGWEGSSLRVALRSVPALTERIEARWAARGPAALRPGDGWWLRDELGVHLTTLLGPTREDPDTTLSRLRLDDVPRDPAHPDLSGGEVEAHLRLRRRGDTLTLRSSLPGGFAEFRVEVDGFVLADLADGRGLRAETDARGWPSLVVELEAPFELHEVVLYHPAANVIVSQRAVGDPAWQQLHFPLLIPRRD